MNLTGILLGLFVARTPGARWRRGGERSKLRIVLFLIAAIVFFWLVGLKLIIRLRAALPIQNALLALQRPNAGDVPG